MSTLQLKERVFQLPSQGKFYKDIPLVNGDSVVIRPLLAGDQRYLAASGDSYSSYTTLLNRIVVEPKSCDFNQFLLVDINAIILGVRVLSFGTLYKMPFLCQDCGELNRAYPVMLDTVELTFADELPGLQVTDLDLELSGKKIKYHLPTLNDERLINAQLNVFRRSKRMKNENTDLAFITLCQKIDTIDEKPVNFEQKFNFLENVSQDEYDSLEEQLNRFTLGVSNSVTTTCEACQKTQSARFVTTPDFFRTNR
jgi:hypothetical protein